MELISLEQFLRRSRSTSSAYKRYSDTELASDTVVLSSSTVTTPWFLSRFPYASSCRLRRVVRRGFSLTVEKIRFREKRKWIQDKNYLNQETYRGNFFCRNLLTSRISTTFVTEELFEVMQKSASKRWIFVT